MKITRVALQVIGALAVLLAIAALAVVAFMSPKFMERTDGASREDVQAVLGWSGLDVQQPFTILHSFQSAWEMDGDFRDFICVQLESAVSADGWVAGPEPDPVMATARTLAAVRGEAARCLGRAIDGNAPELAAFIQIAQVYRREVDGAQIAFFDAKTKRLLYAGFHD